MAPAKDVPLTNDEIWDDSALVDSWNSALDEYKKYHSIHTKGGNVADLLKSRKSDPDDNHEITKEPMDVSAGQNDEHGLGKASENTRNETQTSSANPSAPRLAPEVVLGSVQDESLKRLLMSWYYAGYYTGLYEGQQGQNGQGQA
ncbi:survival motor neuron protein [Microdochium nivale]|nr:survival motor neuron protein [Microdochium nivale]